MDDIDFQWNESFFLKVVIPPAKFDALLRDLAEPGAVLLAEVAIWKFPRFYATWSPTPALDRVPAMAKALDCDSQRLFMLTLEQRWGSTTANVIEEIFGTIVSKYEVVWIAEVRDASKHTDPTLTTRYQTALRAMFPR